MNIKGLFSVHRLIVRHCNTRQGHSCTLITPVPCFRFEYWRSAIRSIPFQVGDSPPPSFDVYLQASASLQKICVFFPSVLRKSCYVIKSHTAGPSLPSSPERPEEWERESKISLDRVLTFCRLPAFFIHIHFWWKYVHNAGVAQIARICGNGFGLIGKCLTSLYILFRPISF